MKRRRGLILALSTSLLGVVSAAFLTVSDAAAHRPGWAAVWALAGVSMSYLVADSAVRLGRRKR